MENNKINKLDMKSKDIIAENINNVGKLFPNVITETENGKKINYELLKQELSNDIVEGNKERYQLTWPGKKKALLTANTQSRNTLRPIIKESINFDTSKNIFIEGENLDALKILQQSYVNEIKMIYIDPPYNTGKDFIFHDKYFTSEKIELESSGQIDDNGNKLVSNQQSCGRYHSNWLSMIYPRIKLARNLLTEDGIIFISIDDNEVDNLRKICDEIFGETNFIAQMVIDGTPKNDPYIVSTAHEYCLVYVKNFDKSKLAGYGIKNPLYSKLQQILDEGKDNYSLIQENLKKFYLDNQLNDDNISNYRYADKKGIYRIGPIDDPQRGGSKDIRMNPKTMKPCLTPKSGWRCSIETWNQWIKEDLILFPDNDDILPNKKTYITDDRLDVLKAYFKMQTRKDTDYLKNLFNMDITPFSNPKPRELLKTLIANCNDKDMIILDFFAGSGSTAEAVMELNAQDNGNRKYILVQVAQPLDPKDSQTNKEKKITEAAIKYLKSKGLPTNISEITKERIRLSFNRIKKEFNLSSLNGFRVYKIDSSNMKDVYYEPSKLKQEQLNMFETNIKEDRTPEDLLTQVILNLGLNLDLSIEEKYILNNKVYFVAENSLVACFDNKININILNEICEEKPLRVVFRESSFRNDSEKINAYEKIKKLSPETEIHVI